MKKILAMAIGMAAVACIASAESATYSKNAVGFIQTQATAEKLYALTVPFENMDSDDGSWKFGDTDLAKNAPDFSVVYFWTDTGWEPAEKDDFDGWPAWAAEKQLKVGEFFFYKPAEDASVVLSGEVPDGAKAVAFVASGNLNAIGYPYPTGVKFGDTDLAKDAPDFSMVYFWTETGWEPAEKDDFDGWPAWAADYEVKPGEGFFYKPDGSESGFWEPVKPYQWP
jgi:hypothetical protein